MLMMAWPLLLLLLLPLLLPVVLLLYQVGLLSLLLWYHLDVAPVDLLLL